MAGLEGFTDSDVRATLVRTLRLLTVLTLVGMALVGWKLGWRSAVLLLVGATISGSGLWEWMRLMSAVMARMDAAGLARKAWRASDGAGFDGFLPAAGAGDRGALC